MISASRNFQTSGCSIAARDVNQEGIGTPYVTGPEQWDGKAFRHPKWTTTPKRIVPDDCVFITVKGAGVGKTFPGVACAIGRDVYAFQPSAELDFEFILRAIQNRAVEIISDARGDIPGLSKSHIEDHEAWVPPLPEQRRIVAKLDRLSARSAAARDHLARTTKLASRARQAILAAAFSGENTTQWRTRNGISAEYGAATISALQDQRQELVATPGKLRKGKGTSPDHHRNPVEISVPDEWALSSLEEVSSPLRLIQYGILKPGQDVPGGVPYVKVMNIRDDEVKLDTIRHTTPEIHANYLRSSLQKGDLLLTIRGTVGRLAFVPQELDGGNITQDTVRIDVLPAMCPRFVFWYLHSPMAERYFRENQKGVAVRGINVGDVRPMEIPVPSRAEQDEIVRRIEAAFARIDRMTEEASRAAHLLDRLDERLLAKAFRGELVPQNPDDEPAEALLTRIREARATAPKTKRVRRKKIDTE